VTKSCEMTLTTVLWQMTVSCYSTNGSCIFWAISGCLKSNYLRLVLTYVGLLGPMDSSAIGSINSSANGVELLSHTHNQFIKIS